MLLRLMLDGLRSRELQLQTEGTKRESVDKADLVNSIIKTLLRRLSMKFKVIVLHYIDNLSRLLLATNQTKLPSK